MDRTSTPERKTIADPDRGLVEAQTRAWLRGISNGANVLEWHRNATLWAVLHSDWTDADKLHGIAYALRIAGRPVSPGREQPAPTDPLIPLAEKAIDLEWAVSEIGRANLVEYILGGFDEGGIGIETATAIVKAARRWVRHKRHGINPARDAVHVAAKARRALRIGGRR